MTTPMSTTYEFANLLHARAFVNGKQDRAVAHASIHANQRLQVGRVDQIDLVDADDRSYSPFLRSDQESIDQVWLNGWLGGATDDQQLVDIRHQDMLSPAARPADNAMPRFHAFDNAFIVLSGTK